MPTSEARLGIPGQLIQAPGLNVRAQRPETKEEKNARQAREIMERYGGLSATDQAEIDRANAQQLEDVPLNAFGRMYATREAQRPSNGSGPLRSPLQNETPWKIVSAELTPSLLKAMDKVWKGGRLTDDEERKLQAIYEQYPFGAPNFATWLKQTMRQHQENDANSRQLMLR